MENNELFHIIWTVLEAYPIWNKNSNFAYIKAIYNNLQEHNINFHLSHELCNHYDNRDISIENQGLSIAEIASLKKDIEKLCSANTDRIIDGLDIKMLRVDSWKIELLVYSNSSVIHQKISRLKSKTASILSSDYREKYQRRAIWSKGIWRANIFNKKDLAISIIKQDNI